MATKSFSCPRDDTAEMICKGRGQAAQGEGKRVEIGRNGNGAMFIHQTAPAESKP